MYADVVEICPPIHLLKKRNRDVSDMDDDDLMIIGENVCKSNKGKTIEAINLDVSDMDDDDLMIIGENFCKSNKGKTIEAINQVVDVPDIDDDGLMIMGGNVCKSNKGKPIEAINQVVGVFHNDDDLVIIGENVRKSSKGKAIEAINQLAVSPDVDYDPGFKNNHVAHSFQPSWPLEAYNSRIQGSTQFSSYSLQIKLDSVDHSPEMESSELSSQDSHSKKKSVASLDNGCPRLNISLGAESSNFERLLKPFTNKMKSADLQGNPKTRKVVQASKPSLVPKFKTHQEGSCSYSYQANIKDEIMRKFKCLKKFNARDSPFCIKKPIKYEYSPNWVKRIQKEWKILEKNLPDSIYVRVYESKMDVMRVVIIGAEGTPYHDGLFFFDLFLNGFFPNIPPQVNFHNRIGSSKLNPNFNLHGNVCLSLLNTWIGDKNEHWLPDFSTILQVLVSLQGLVLTPMPLLNAPQTVFKNYPKNPSPPHSQCHRYNEQAFIDSLWLMIHIIRRPPKGFEDFVVEHFRNRAHDIMGACKAYKEGAQVGSLVKSGFHVVDEGSKVCSEVFKNSLREPMEQLVREFDRIGAKY